MSRTGDEKVKGCREGEGGEEGNGDLLCGAEVEKTLGVADPEEEEEEVMEDDDDDDDDEFEGDKGVDIDEDREGVRGELGRSGFVFSFFWTSIWFNSSKDMRWLRLFSMSSASSFPLSSDWEVGVMIGAKIT